MRCLTNPSKNTRGPASQWFTLTPMGALHAFASKAPGETELALQALMAGEWTLDMAEWISAHRKAPAVLSGAVANGWVQPLRRPVQCPKTRLDDFLPQVIASLSGECRAVLASEDGFCLGRAGMAQDQAEIVSAAAADYSEFATRQARRGWDGATRCVAFHGDAPFVQPNCSFVPFWVDGAGYWLIVMGEPRLNNPALLELIWAIKQAGSRAGSAGKARSPTDLAPGGLL
jgi:hypothetical protein